MDLRDAIAFVSRLQKELILFNVDPVDSIDTRLAALFETQNVEISTARTPAGRPTVAVLSNRNGVLAVVDLSLLRSLVSRSSPDSNGLGVADTAYEEILAHLKETTFTSYNATQLYYASREIEDRARRVGTGTIHTGFQRVSVMSDQQAIYEDLAGRGVDVHMYGVPDTTIPELTGTIHAVTTAEIRDMWFVVFDGGGDDRQKTALLAEQQDDGTFYGVWTYDPGIVDPVCTYLERRYVGSMGGARPQIQE